MNIHKITLLSALIVFLISCKENHQKALSEEKKKDLDAYLHTAMEIHNIPGLALAIIDDDEVIYRSCLGKVSMASNIPVTDKTVFRVFSTTKLITATGIFQLIEAGKVSLKDKISMYFDHLPASWRKVNIEHLLTHSSGLPDLRYPRDLSDEEVLERLSEDQMDFETGNQFRYNQTNYWLLAKIIEKVTGSSFDAYILKNQFPHSKDGAFFSSNSKKEIENRSPRYYYDPEKGAFRKDTLNFGTRAHSGNGLNISLDEFIAWNERLDNNELLKKETKTQMWTPFQFHNKKDTFLHGWGIYNVDNKISYGFTGGNLSGFRKFLTMNMTIILVSNGYQHPGYDLIINDVSKIITNEHTESLVLEQEVMRQILGRNYENAKSTFTKLREQDSAYGFDNLKWNINSIGNSFFRSENIEEACLVYQMNAEVNPDWWVSQAGYAEGLEKKGDIDQAIHFYREGIRLNVNNEYNYNTFMNKKLKELKDEKKTAPRK